MEHHLTLPHLKPILQGLVLIENARFPLPGQRSSTKFLEGIGEEPLALALNALCSCRETLHCGDTFFTKLKCFLVCSLTSH